MCQRSVQTFRHNPCSTQTARLTIGGRSPPFTARAVAADYVALCHDPLRDIQRWAIESKPSYQSCGSFDSPLAGRYCSQASRSAGRTAPAISALRSPSPAQRGPPIGPHPRFRGRLKALPNQDHSAPLSTRGLAADYVTLCRNPLSNVRRWILESGPSYSGTSPDNLETWSTSHAQTPSPGLARPVDRFCNNPLHAVRSRLDPQRAGGQRHHLSSRPGAGLYQYDQLRSLPTAQTPPAEARSVPDAASPGAAPSTSLAAELTAAKGYYAGRMAAARQSLSQADLAAAIRAIQHEQTLATRAIIDRWEVYFQNKKQGLSEAPRRPGGNRSPLRYGELRKN
jgi:hypothetical protein